MNQQQRNVLLGIGIAVAVLVIIILIFILRSSAPKINQIHSIGSQYQLVPTNDSLTFIDNNSNLQQYTDKERTASTLSHAIKPRQCDVKVTWH